MCQCRDERTGASQGGGLEGLMREEDRDTEPPTIGKLREHLLESILKDRGYVPKTEGFRIRENGTQ